MQEATLNLCTVCGEFMPLTEFEISEEVCKWCDVTIRDEGGIK